MNTLLHPDTLYDLNKLYQEERQKESQREQTLHPPSKLADGRFQDELFLAAGELLIVLGKKLKSRAVQPACTAQPV